MSSSPFAIFDVGNEVYKFLLTDKEHETKFIKFSIDNGGVASFDILSGRYGNIIITGPCDLFSPTLKEGAILRVLSSDPENMENITSLFIMWVSGSHALEGVRNEIINRLEYDNLHKLLDNYQDNGD